MKKLSIDFVSDLNSISAALEFISDAIENADAEGKDLNKGGIAYLVRFLSKQSSLAAETYWGGADESYISEE